MSTVELERVQASDFCVFSELDVPLSKQGLVFIFGENHDTGGATSNGAGKTTIFKAISWCLYGECVDGDSGDEVIRRGTKRTSVTVTIKADSQRWLVTRARTKGKPHFTIQREGDAEPMDKPKDELQEFIIGLVGLDFHAFKNTVLYGANDIVKFADPRTKDSDRKEMLHCILRTSILQVAHRKALDRAKEVRGEMDAIDKKLEAADAAIEAVDLESMKRRRDSWQSEHDEAIKSETDKAQACRDEAKRLGDIDYNAAIAVKRDEIAKLSALHDEATKHGDLDALNEQLDKSRENYGLLQSQRDKLEAQLDLCIEGIDGLKGKSECPMCKSPLNEGHAAQHLKQLKAQKTDLQARIDGFDKQLKEAEKVGKEIRAKRDAAVNKMNAASEIARSIRAFERELATKERERDQSKRDIDAQVTKARMHLQRAKELRDEINPHLEAYKEGREKVKGLQAKRAKLAEERADLDMMLAHVTFWTKGFSGRGLPSFILDSAMPVITARANHYLETLADGDITMDFQTQRALKSAKGEVRDEITITATIEGNEGVTPSSGQRTKMNVATDLALMDLVATREHGHLDILMLDEVMDGLDAEGTERVLQLLQELRAVRSSVFVISHGANMAEIFEHGLKVVKDGGSATVECVS